MSGTTKFHEAARDGYLDFLREATRKDCNTPDDTGMTPTLLAAYQGNVDALRLLVSRGGDPDKCDLQGHTAVHFAALAGHLSTLMFLQSFGCNIWGLTNDYRTAKDLSAENGHKQCLDLLDDEAAKQSANSRKQVQKLKEKALKEADTRVRKYQRAQKEHEQRLLKEQKKLQKENEKQRKYVKKTAGTAPSSQRQRYAAKKERDIAAENRAKRMASIGVAGGKDVGVDENGDIKLRDEDIDSFIDETFGTIGNQEEDELNPVEEEDENDIREPGFWIHTERPIAHAMMTLPSDVTTPDKPVWVAAGEDLLDDAIDIEHVTNEPKGHKVSTTRMSNSNNGEQRHGYHHHHREPAANIMMESDPEDLPWNEDDLEDLEDDEETSPLELFLAVYNLDEYLPLFSKEDVDLESLMLLTDDDLKQMNLPLGPRRKLAGAIKQRKDALSRPRAMVPTEL